MLPYAPRCTVLCSAVQCSALGPADPDLWKPADREIVLCKNRRELFKGKLPTILP